MISKRIIPCLDVRDGSVVKGTNFQNLGLVGSPVELARFYSDHGADDLRVIEGRAEKRAQQQCAGAREALRVPIRAEVPEVGAIGDGHARAVRPHEHRRDRGLVLRAQDAGDVHAAVFQRGEDQLARRVRAEGAEDPRARAQLRRGQRGVDGLAAHVQGSGLGAVAGCGDRFRLEAADDGIDQRHSDAEDVKHFSHPFAPILPQGT